MNNNDTDARKFVDVIGTAYMTQHVTGLTHSKGHTLVLIITRGDVNLVYDVRVLPGHFSDHKVVFCKQDRPTAACF